MNNRLLYADPVVTSLDAPGLIKRLNGALGCNAQDIRSSLLILMSYSVYMTYEEIYSLYPVKQHVVRELNYLISKGYVVKKDFEQAVGTCSIFFAITISGFDEAQRRSIGHLPGRYKYARKAGAYVHTYYAGYNLYQMLKLPFCFSWKREYLGDNYDYKKDFKKRILQVDALCTLDPGTKNERRLYIEEDTGKERFPILLNKFENYERLSYITPYRPNDKVIISCVDDSASSRYLRKDALNPFSTKRLTSLINFMECSGFFDLSEVVADGSFENMDYVRNFISMVTGTSYTDDMRVINAGKFINVEILRSFRHELEHSRNLFLLGEMNLRHINVSLRRLNSIAIEAVKDYASSSWVYPLSKGFQLLCVPTTLLADRLKFTMPSSFDDIRIMYEKVFSVYFKNVRFKEDLSSSIHLDTDIRFNRYTSFNLRNVFSYDADGKKGLLSLEMPFIDAGSWLRCFLFSKYYKGDIPINVVCIFENDSQAELFYKLIGHVYKHMNILPGESGLFGIDFTGVRGFTEQRLYVMDDLSDFSEKRRLIPLI